MNESGNNEEHGEGLAKVSHCQAMLALIYTIYSQTMLYFKMLLSYLRGLVARAGLLPAV